jgi:hypothetical protein
MLLPRFNALGKTEIQNNMDVLTKDRVPSKMLLSSFNSLGKA